MAPSATRDRICRHAYRRSQGGNPLGLIEDALQSALAVEPLERRLRVDGLRSGRVTALDFAGQVAQAREIGLLDDDQARQLLAHDALIMQIIHVDDFDPRELGARHV
jgi:acyl-CoA dehydrogenase